MTRCRRGVAVLVLLLLAVSVPGPVHAEVIPPPRPVIEGPPPASWPAPPTIDATAWLLVEAATGQILAARAHDVRRPVASTVKVLTALTIVCRVDLEDLVTVGDEVVDVEGAGVGLAPGDVWTVEQLLDALIARSGNDAAEALAAHVAGSTPAFVELMAADAARLGIDGAVLTSPSGLDDANLLSAADLATMARAALADPDLRPLLARAVVDLPGLGEVESRNELLTTYPDATGVKTGFTLAAGNSLVASAVRADRELVAVVLDAGDDPARFQAAAQLLDHGFERFVAGTVAGHLSVAVAGGEVAFEVAPVPVTTPSGSPPVLAFHVPAQAPAGPTAVPVAVAGETVATVPASLDRSAAPADVPTADAAPGTAELGRAIVDSAYAALRAATTAEVLR